MLMVNLVQTLSSKECKFMVAHKINCKYYKLLSISAQKKVFMPERRHRSKL